MDKDPTTRRIVDQVFTLIKSSPAVTIAQLERECLGKKPGYLRWARANDALRLSQLSQILAYLGIQPDNFFRVVFAGRTDGPDHHLLRIGAHADAVVDRKDEPASLATLRKRFLCVELDRTEDPSASAERDIEPPDTKILSRSLAALDIMTQGSRDDCEQAARLAEAAALAADNPHDVTAALGIWATAVKILYRLDEATAIITLGLKICLAHRLGARYVRLLQRASSIARNRGAFNQALALVDESIVLAVHRGSETLLAKGLIHRGNVLNFRREPRAAVRAFESALDHLDTSERWDRFAAHVGLAQAAVETGDLAVAEKALAETDGTAAGTGYALGAVSLICAKVAAMHGDLEEAEHHYLESLYAYWQHPPCAIGVAVELLALEVELDRGPLACRMARDLARFEPAVRDNPLLHSLLVDLLRRANHDGLTLPFVRRIQRLHDVALHPDRAAVFRAAHARAS